MTRLNDALTRAGATDGDIGMGDSAGSGVPRSWQFEDVENVERNDPAIADSQEVPLAAFEYQFGDTTSGKVVVGPGADAGLVEQYRRLGAVLHHSQNERGTRSVMVASAMAEEGKTLTSTNIALTLSHSYQRRVLLIDADLRRPAMHQVFRLRNNVGLGDGLKRPEVGRLPVQRISRTLWILTAGHPNPDPMSALVSDTMKQVIAEATEQFDWVVIDTPPVGLMPDANLLARMIDSALLVVRAGSTPYPMVKRAVDAIGEARILGVVLNRARRADLAGGDGYYRYYYNHFETNGEEKSRSGSWLFGNKHV